ncbi:hypothetical protein EMCRGX_G034320, partial [Ephydatia muelleri]
ISANRLGPRLSSHSLKGLRTKPLTVNRLQIMVLELDEKVGDVYAQLSVYGLYLLVILLVLICLAWSRYGAAISTVFDAKAKACQTEIQASSDGTSSVSSELLSPTTWEDTAFVLSPDTRRLDQATKKLQ